MGAEVVSTDQTRLIADSRPLIAVFSVRREGIGEQNNHLTYFVQHVSFDSLQSGMHV